MRTFSTLASMTIGSAFALAATTAMAQEPTTNPPPAVEAPRVTTRVVTTEARTNGMARGGDDDTTDHEKVVGRFAVGYLGLKNIPVAGGAGDATIAAPVIGGRYWLSKFLGIDAGIGLALGSASLTTKTAVKEETTDGPSAFGLAFHGGVPLALASGRHYTFEIVPEANVAFASSTKKGTNAPDEHFTGNRIDVGARAGAEIQFGFIGVPELSLQATVGLYFSHQNRKHTSDAFNNVTETSESVNSTTLSSSLQSDPWALFTNNISALYYF